MVTCIHLQAFAKNTDIEQHSCTTGGRYNNICFITLFFSPSLTRERYQNTGKKEKKSHNITFLSFLKKKGNRAEVRYKKKKSCVWAIENARYVDKGEDGGEKTEREHTLANSGCICFFSYSGKERKRAECEGERERESFGTLLIFFFCCFLFDVMDLVGWLAVVGEGEETCVFFISCARVYLTVLDSDRLLAFLSLL